jgi:hypothetical protein
MRKLRYYYAAFLLVCLAGCAQLGLAPAQNFDQKLAYAYGVHTAVVQATTSALDAKTVKSLDATRLFTLAEQARQLLDGAKLASAGGDITTANQRLSLATSILAEVQTYLRSKQ